MCLTIVEGTKAETLVVQFPDWQTFTGDNGGVTSLTLLKNKYNVETAKFDTEKKAFCKGTWKDLVAKQATDYAPVGWTAKAFFVDNDNKRLSLDVTRAFNTNETDSDNLITLKPNTTYQVGLQWANYTLGQCTTSNGCIWKGYNSIPVFNNASKEIIHEWNYPDSVKKGDFKANYNTMPILNNAMKLASALTAVSALVF